MISIFKKISSYFPRRTSVLIERAKMTEHTFMIVLAVIIGVLAGYGAIAFKTLIELISDFSFPGPSILLDNIANSPWYKKLFIPSLGGAVVGPLIYFYAREAKGHGVPEVMQAVALKNGVIRPRVVFIKSLASGITIGTGGSVGREGPIVQIGQE